MRGISAMMVGYQIYLDAQRRVNIPNIPIIRGYPRKQPLATRPTSEQDDVHKKTHRRVELFPVSFTGRPRQAYYPIRSTTGVISSCFRRVLSRRHVFVEDSFPLLDIPHPLMSSLIFKWLQKRLVFELLPSWSSAYLLLAGRKSLEFPAS